MTETPLTTKWTLWHRSDPRYETGGVRPGLKDTKEFDQGLLRVGSFRTVEMFWRIFNQLPPVHEWSTREQPTLFLMREDVPPVWEAEENKEGSSIAFRIPWTHSPQYQDIWIRLCLAAIGERIYGTLRPCSPAVDIQGVTVSIREHGDMKLSIWFQGTDNQLGQPNYIQQLSDHEILLGASGFQSHYHPHVKTIRRHADRNVKTPHPTTTLYFPPRTTTHTSNKSAHTDYRGVISRRS